jgi:hypothetical protein
MLLVSLPFAVTLVAPLQLKLEPGAAPASLTVSAAASTHLRLWCSAGELSHAQANGGGQFSARWNPPAGGKPTFAVLAAWDDDSGEAATATVTLIARTEIPVETEAGAQVVAVVHGRRSTARANASGHARVPAWVWPGDRTATVTALDAAGNGTTSEVALALAPPDVVFLLAPAALVPGEPVRVYAFASGTAAPQLTATGATLSSIVSRPGVATAMLRARADATLTATAGGDHAQQQIRAATVTPPPARSLELIAQPPLPKWAQPKPPR